MIDLDRDRSDALERLVRAGPEGLALDVIGIGTCLHLALHGLAEITNKAEPPQRVHARARAAAFLRARAFA